MPEPKFEKATITVQRRDLHTQQLKPTEVSGFKFGDTGLGYNHEGKEGYYIVHLASGYSLGLPVDTQRQVRGIITEAAKMPCNWKELDGTALATTALIGGETVLSKFRGIYKNYAT